MSNFNKKLNSFLAKRENEFFQKFNSKNNSFRNEIDVDGRKYIGCMSSLKRLDVGNHTAFFPNSWDIDVKILEKYVDLILNGHEFLRNNITDISIEKEGIECQITHSQTNNNRKMDLFLYYFFRCISLNVLKEIPYYTVKGVEQGLSLMDALHAASFCCTGSCNYFIFENNYITSYYSGSTHKHTIPKSFYYMLETKRIPTFQEYIDKILEKEYNLLVYSVYGMSYENNRFVSNDYRCCYYSANSLENEFTKHIYNVYKKYDKKNINLFNFYNELKKVFNSFDLKTIILKKDKHQKYPKLFSSKKNRNQMVCLIKKTNNSEKVYGINYSKASTFHVLKKDIKKII